MKKFIALVMGLCLAVGLYAQQINPKVGYLNGITWGMKRADVQKKLPGGGKFTKLDKTKVASMYEGYKGNIVVYTAPTKDPASARNINWWYFLDDKLFMIIEQLKVDESTEQKLIARYGNLKQYKYPDGTKFYADKAVAKDGYITQSINVSFTESGSLAGCAEVTMYDREVLKKVLEAGLQEYDMTPESIVDSLESLANKLVQASSTKATYAFVALTSDDGNALVENYVTDALTEAMFNTGKIKIVERASIEKIMSEQQFQSSSLINENTAVEIGNLSGANYVCYGTVKDIDDQIALNVKVVQVSTAELCAMGRENVYKDKYLQSVGFESRSGSGSASTSSGTKTTAKKNTTSQQNVKSDWEVRKKRNEKEGYTTYTFVLKGSSDPFLFVGYDKYDGKGGNGVKAGVYWAGSGQVGKIMNGTYDVKGDDNKVISKEYSSHGMWSFFYGWKAKIGADPSYWYTYYNDSRDECFAFTYKKGESARFWVEMFEDNQYVTVRHNDESYRFKTEGLWKTVEEQGLTREEIMDVIASEEF